MRPTFIFKATQQLYIKKIQMSNKNRLRDGFRKIIMINTGKEGYYK